MTSDDFCNFLTPHSPLISCFISTALLIKSDLVEPPLPPYHLTSYMNGPISLILFFAFCSATFVLFCFGNIESLGSCKL